MTGIHDPEFVKSGFAAVVRFASDGFRLQGKLAHVVFVDGHAEQRSDFTRNPPAATDSAAVVQIRDDQNLYDIGTDDTLWDRE